MLGRGPLATTPLSSLGSGSFGAAAELRAVDVSGPGYVSVDGGFSGAGFVFQQDVREQDERYSVMDDSDSFYRSNP